MPPLAEVFDASAKGQHQPLTGELKEIDMQQQRPWHSTRLGETRYHDNDTCTEGNNIERYYFAWGTGGKQLCDHCSRLDQRGK